MSSKRRLPQVFAVLAGTVSACTPASENDYNCVLRHNPDGGDTLYTLRDGSPVTNRSVCQTPHCNGSFDGGLGMLVYIAPNGDQSPCMA